MRRRQEMSPESSSLMKPGLPTAPIHTSKTKKALYICCGMAIAAVVVMLAFTGAVFAVIGVNGYPIHASCKITWRFGASCRNVSETIINQIDKWHGEDNCGKGQKCLYSLTSTSDNGTLIHAKHETPVKHYIDDLTFRLSPIPSDPNACSGKGESRSETWYAILDYGTNYCNLHNLITGSGLDQMAGYKEDTSNSQCTQYSSANCEKY